MPTLRVESGARAGEQLELDGERFAIGRADGNDLALDSAAASGMHCVLIRRQGRWCLQDRDSTNGTFLNGARVREARLRNGDRIGVGETELIFEEAGMSAEPTVVHPAFTARGRTRWRFAVLGVAIALATLAAAVWFFLRLFVRR